MNAEERAARREAIIQGVVERGHPRERAEEIVNLIAKMLFGPGGRFAPDPEPLPLHRTEAGYPNCSTCDGGGCLDCTDPA